MKHWQLEALLDLTIEYVPKAREAREHARRWGSSEVQYYNNLLVNAVFTQAKLTATAVERLAAQLMGQVLLPLTGHGYEGIDEHMCRLALDLCSATGKPLPWLSEQVVGQSASPATVEPKKPTSTATVLDKPLLTSMEAAELLSLKVQTLHSWSSKQNGPIQPVKVSRRIYWKTADIMAHLEKARS